MEVKKLRDPLDVHHLSIFCWLFHHWLLSVHNIDLVILATELDREEHISIHEVISKIYVFPLYIVLEIFDGAGAPIKKNEHRGPILKRPDGLSMLPLDVEISIAHAKEYLVEILVAYERSITLIVWANSDIHTIELRPISQFNDIFAISQIEITLADIIPRVILLSGPETIFFENRALRTFGRVKMHVAYSLVALMVYEALYV